MTKLVALDPKAHRDLKVDTNYIETTWADVNMVPVVLTEFSKLIVQFPIVFSKNVETGQFVCVSLMAFEKGQNLFWNEGQFNSIYTPLTIGHAPFYVGQDEQSNGEYVLCVDTESSSLIDDGQALFDSGGEPTQLLKEAQSKLHDLVEGRPQTERFINKLLEYNLLTKLSLDITFENGSQNTIRGLYSVDEEALSNISDSEILALQQSGYLQLIHIQVASLGQIYSLIHKKNKIDESHSS